MQRDLLDALRCPGAHEEAWLVAMVHAADGADLREADLACPACGREFTVREGIACFCTTPCEASPASAPGPADADAGMRLAAQLAVTGGAAPVLLAGEYRWIGLALRAWSSAPQLWLEASPVALPRDAGISQFCVDRVPLPLGAATLAGAAVDSRYAHGTWLTGIVRSVRQGGRIVAPAGIPVPDGVRELARDEREWVGEVLTPPSGLVTLRRQSVPA